MLNECLIRKQRNKVTIRVWKARNRLSLKRVPGKSKTGHVSLETYTGGLTGSGIYASFYPLQEGAGFLDSTRNPYQRPLKEDLKKKPDVEVDLYSLDVPAINKAYQAFVNAGSKWDTWASSAHSKDGTSNCVALTNYLLKQGGVENLNRGVLEARKAYKYVTGGVIFGIVLIAGGITIAVLTHGFACPILIGIGLMTAGTGVALKVVISNPSCCKDSVITPNDFAGFAKELLKAEDAIDSANINKKEDVEDVCSMAFI